MRSSECGMRNRSVANTPHSAFRTPHSLGCGVPVRTIGWRKELALLGARRIDATIKAFRPDVVMERYYNFAGAGVLAARRRGIPVLLEVNAPMVDPPGSLKSRIDRLLLGSMRRWAVRQAKWSAAIVTPLNTTVPPEVPRGKIHELPWGANVDRFDPCIRKSRKEELDALAVEIGLERPGPVAAFLGSFRAWHGAGHFAEAARILLVAGQQSLVPGHRRRARAWPRLKSVWRVGACRPAASCSPESSRTILCPTISPWPT